MASPLTQGRGLKSLEKVVNSKWKNVAPHAGAWIEMVGGLLT